MDAVGGSVVVTGTIVYLDGQVVVVPTEPPAPTRLPRSEEFRRSFLAENPGWTPDDARSAAATRRESIQDRLRADSFAVVELHGADLPADFVRAKVRGEITGRSVYVDSWEAEPYSTSLWAEPQVEGTDSTTAEAIADTVSEEWPLISIGISTTTGGRRAVMLEVDHLTREIRTWFERQPPGSVQLDAFIDLATALEAANP